MLENYGFGLREGFTCRLGMFYPIPYEEAELLRKEHDKPNSTRGGVKTQPAEVPPKSAAPPAASEPAPPSEQAPQGDSAPRCAPYGRSNGSGPPFKVTAPSARLSSA